MDRKKLVIVSLTVAIAVMTSVVFAATFTYYPLGVTVTPANPVVKFATGNNANSNDVSGSALVSIGENQTSATITIHPTYQVTYYENLTLINNTDTKSWTIWLKVTQPITGFPSGSKVYLVVYDSGASRSLTGYPTPTPESGTYVMEIDLTSTSSAPVEVGTLSAGSHYEVDLYVYIPEGSTLPSSATAGVMLIATPGTETPP